MTQLSKWTLTLSAALGAALLTHDANVMAQCTTCGTPTVAFSPVIAAPVAVTPTVVRTGWYPGYWIDRMRINRWSTAYAPTYTTAFAPTYTAAFAPAVGFATSNAPYVTAYAPLQSAVVTAAYAPAVSSGCSSCGTAVATSFAPSTVYRPVEVAPVVDAVVAPACSACSSCSSCSACTGGATQAIYTPASTGCSSCDAAAGQPNYTYPAPGSASPSTTNPPTPQPEIAPSTAVPSTSGYPTTGTAGSAATGTQGAAGAQTPSGSQGTAAPPKTPDPKPEADDAADPNAAKSGSTTSLEAPSLLGPFNDRQAHRPTVDVHNAVYRQAVRSSNVSTAIAAKPAADANGWYGIADR